MIAPARLAAVFACVAGCGRIGYDALPASEVAADATSSASGGDADTRACGRDTLICSGFDGDLGTWIARDQAGAGSELTLVAEPRFEGAGALEVRVDGSDGAFAMAEHVFASLGDGTLYGRVMLWVDAATDFDEYLVVVQLDDGDDSGADKVSIDLLPDDRIALTATTAHPVVDVRTASDVVRRDDWMCLRFEIEIAGAGGRMRLRDADRDVASAEGIDTRAEPSGFHRLLIGAAAPRRVHSVLVFDAVAVASTPVGCP